uniref:Uncharacterized protein n=1 Tax=Vitis vinifera TaxID=29760 RepID=F6HRB6_VITVI
MHSMVGSFLDKLTHLPIFFSNNQVLYIRRKIGEG